MIYWYKSLYIGESLAKDIYKHVKNVERVYRKRYKKGDNEDKHLSSYFIKSFIHSYHVVIKPLNENNLFDIMDTRQWIFSYYKKRDIYVIGIFPDKKGAIGLVKKLIETGYDKDDSYDPRGIYADEDAFLRYREWKKGVI